jgi:hypothetical protein
MVGHYQNKKKEYLVFLKVWVDKVIANRLWEKYNDLHIDKIDDLFIEKKYWISGSMFLFDSILSLIDKTKYDIFLVIPLSCSSCPIKLNNFKLKSLDKEFDITPPSFYLFPVGEKNYENTIKLTKQVEIKDNNINFRVYYKEEEENGEYYRTIYIRK